jgi:hypothetical protein
MTEVHEADFRHYVPHVWAATLVALSFNGVAKTLQLLPCLSAYTQ